MRRRTRLRTTAWPSLVLTVSLLLSWILALTLVPVLADKRLKVKGNREGDPYGNSYYRALRSVLNWVLSHRIVSLCVGFGLVAVSLLCFRTLPQGFFPDMDYDQLYICLLYTSDAADE